MTANPEPAERHDNSTGRRDSGTGDGHRRRPHPGRGVVGAGAAHRQAATGRDRPEVSQLEDLLDVPVPARGAESQHQPSAPVPLIQPDAVSSSVQVRRGRLESPCPGLPTR